MIFSRRDKLPLGARLREWLWPSRGWSRALNYLRLRLNRIPDSPQRIARGIAAGVLASFTPFFGLHMVLSATLAWVLRGNVIASLLGSFFGNPVTLPLIAVASLWTGRKILGHAEANLTSDTVTDAFTSAVSDIGHNLWAIVTGAPQHWAGVRMFVDGVFIPYLIGGLLPGVICAFICYAVALKLVSAYQIRRRNRLRARLEQARRKLETQSPASAPHRQQS